MKLPRTLGTLTVVRHYDADTTSGCFVGLLDEPPTAQRVLARRIAAEAGGTAALLGARVSELRGARHPSLAQVMGLVEDEDACWVVEAWRSGIPLSAVLRKCASRSATLPNDVFLHLATLLCTAVEALHARPGSSSAHTLHLGLSTASISVGVDGHPTLGRYGLVPVRHGPAGHGAEYRAPEQAVPDARIGPSTDVFSLGAVLYELLTLKPMFRSDNQQLRRVDVTTQLIEVKEAIPGFDKVLLRALSPNPAHRYQSAFVLREDLRGLLAGYPCPDRDRAARDFFAPIVRTTSRVWEHEPPVEEPGTETNTMRALLVQGVGWARPVEDFLCAPPEDTDPTALTLAPEPETERLPDILVDSLELLEDTPWIAAGPVQSLGIGPSSTRDRVADPPTVRLDAGLDQMDTERVRRARPPPLVVPLFGHSADFGADPESNPTVRMASRGFLDPSGPAAQGFPTLVRFDGDTVPISSATDEFVHPTPSVREMSSARLSPAQLRIPAPVEVTEAPPRAARSRPEAREGVPTSFWMAALITVLVIGVCIGVPSAGILTIVATNHEPADRPATLEALTPATRGEGVLEEPPQAVSRER